jgi:hypothetical protein
MWGRGPAKKIMAATVRYLTLRYLTLRYLSAGSLRVRNRRVVIVVGTLCESAFGTTQTE